MQVHQLDSIAVGWIFVRLLDGAAALLGIRGISDGIDISCAY